MLQVGEQAPQGTTMVTSSIFRRPTPYAIAVAGMPTRNSVANALGGAYAWLIWGFRPLHA